MPKRPRQHELESESYKYFNSLLPSGWVFREKSHDYGIDGEVEVFDEDGNSTGRVFLVQLKATDSESNDKVLRVRLKLDACRYCNSLELPVLLVRYCAPHCAFYVRWIDTFDLSYTQEGQKTVTLPLVVSDRWCASTPDALLFDIDHFRQIRTGNVNLPIPFWLNRSEPHLNGISGVLIDSALRERIASLSGLLTISNIRSEDQLGSIRLSNKETQVSFCGIRDFIFHIHEDTPRGSTPWEYANDILVCMAIALSMIKKYDIATRLLTRDALMSGLMKVTGVSSMIGQVLIAAGRYKEVLDLSELLLREGETSCSSVFLYAELLARHQHMSGSEREYLEHYLRKQVEIAERANDSLRMAAALYNLGRYVSMEGRLSESFALYEAAARKDPRYIDRHYYCAELAGLHFERGSYHLSSCWYKRALDFGGDLSVKARYSDSLLFGGRYQESQVSFEACFQSVAKWEPEWYLKMCLVNMIRSGLHVDRQKRSYEAAVELATSLSGLTQSAKKDRLLEALRLDALCPVAWFNFGVESSTSQDHEDAFIGFLAAGLISRTDIEAWTNAIAIGFSREEIPVLTWACACHVAYSVIGERLLEHMDSLLKSQSSEFPSEPFLERFNKALSLVSDEVMRRKDPGLELRFLGEENELLILQVKNGTGTDIQPRVIKGK